jgi:hypothetical protein
MLCSAGDENSASRRGGLVNAVLTMQMITILTPNARAFESFP